MRTKPRTKRNLRDLKVEDQTHNVVFPSQQHPDSACVFRSTRDDKPFHFTLKVQSFSFLKAALAKSQRHRYESHSFDVGEVNVVFTFLIYDNLKDKYLTVQDGKIRCFHAMKTEWGFEKLVSLDTFNDASNGLLVDDCCVFGVDIFVMKCNDRKGEEDPVVSKRMLGSEIRLLVHIINCWFGFGANEAGSGWGTPNFSSLNVLQEPTKGYLVNDTLVVESFSRLVEKKC
uniref:MATH domain-containing protein n=1 Tax=Cucumis melo TaxID=3656 RepID=A0A9I9EHU5_CUCME